MRVQRGGPNLISLTGRRLIFYIRLGVGVGRCIKTNRKELNKSKKQNNPNHENLASHQKIISATPTFYGKPYH